MIFKKITPTQLLLLFISLFLFGFTPSYGDPKYNIEQILAETLANHPALTGKKNEYAAATQSLDTSKWQRFPGVSVVTSAGQNSTLRNTTGVISTIRLDQPLWTGGRITGNIDSAKAKLLAAEQGVLEVEQGLLTKSATAFSEILRLNQRIEAANESVLEHQRLLELIQHRARSEISPMSEIILAKARLDQAKSDRTQMQSQLANTKSQLDELVGHPISDLNPPKFSFILPNKEEDAIKQTLEYSPTLKRFAAQIKSAEADVEVAKSRYFPELSARSDETYGGVAPGNTTYLALTYQPGNGLSVLSASREAESRKEIAEAALNNSRVDIKTSVHSDWNQYTSQLQQIETLSNLAETTRGVFESFVRQYTVGKKTWIEVLNARKEATQAKYSLADAQWQSFIAGIRLQISAGILNSDTLMMVQ